jgi:CheY-like chemotaxis protein
MATILVVDDDDLVLEVLVAVLEAAGYTVRAVATEAAGTQALRAALPDLLLTDLRLGSAWDGVALVARARTLSLRLPVIALSGHGRQALDMAAVAGANATLSKPFGPQDLLQVVQGLLVAARAERA